LWRGSPVGRVGTQAQADGEAHLRVLGGLEHRGRDALAEALGHLDPSLLERVGEDHGELVASETRHQVDLAQLGTQPAGQVEQHPITGLVPVAVVELVEIVKVENQKHEGVSEPVGTVAFVSEALLEDPVAGHAGQGIDGGGVDEHGGLGAASPARGKDGGEQRGAGRQQDRLGPGKGIGPRRGDEGQ